MALENTYKSYVDNGNDNCWITHPIAKDNDEVDEKWKKNEWNDNGHANRDEKNIQF